MNEKKWSFRSREEIKLNVDSLAMQKIYRLMDSKEDPAKVLDIMRGIRELHLAIVNSIHNDEEDEAREREAAKHENLPND